MSAAARSAYIVLLLPLYKIAELMPPTREGGRLRLVTLEQRLNALTCAVDNPVSGIRILEVSEIRKADI